MPLCAPTGPYRRGLVSAYTSRTLRYSGRVLLLIARTANTVAKAATLNDYNGMGLREARFPTCSPYNSKKSESRERLIPGAPT